MIQVVALQTLEPIPMERMLVPTLLTSLLPRPLQALLKPTLFLIPVGSAMLPAALELAPAISLRLPLSQKQKRLLLHLAWDPHHRSVVVRGRMQGSLA